MERSGACVGPGQYPCRGLVGSPAGQVDGRVEVAVDDQTVDPTRVDPCRQVEVAAPTNSSSTGWGHSPRSWLQAGSSTPGPRTCVARTRPRECTGNAVGAGLRLVPVESFPCAIVPGAGARRQVVGTVTEGASHRSNPSLVRGFISPGITRRHGTAKPWVWRSQLSERRSRRQRSVASTSLARSPNGVTRSMQWRLLFWCIDSPDRGWT